MRSPGRTILASLLFATVAAAAPADVTNVLPLSVAEGTKITVTGAGFGKSPSAVLVNGPDRVKLTLVHKPKPVDGEFHAIVQRGPAGTYDLDVKAKGSPTTQTFAGVTVEPPTADSLSVASAKGKGTVTVTGTFFGKSRGQVTVGGAKASLKSWDWKHGKARFSVPLGLPVGPAAVVVVNRSGAASDGSLKLDITSTGGNGETVTGTFGPVSFVADQYNTYGYSDPEDPNRRFTVDARTTANYPTVVSIFIQGRMPKTNTTFPITVPASVSYSSYNPKKGFTENYHTFGASGSMTITSISGGYLVGTFTGSLIIEQGMGTMGSPIAGDGQFRAKMKIN